jgi:hypothetical protein
VIALFELQLVDDLRPPAALDDERPIPGRGALAARQDGKAVSNRRGASRAATPMESSPDLTPPGEPS